MSIVGRQLFNIFCKLSESDIQMCLIKVLIFALIEKENETIKRKRK